MPDPKYEKLKEDGMTAAEKESWDKQIAERVQAEWNKK
jgi:hypothetical protein